MINISKRPASLAKVLALGFGAAVLTPSLIALGFALIALVLALF